MAPRDDAPRSRSGAGDSKGFARVLLPVRQDESRVSFRLGLVGSAGAGAAVEEPRGDLYEFALLVTNNGEERLEGQLTIFPPECWSVEPGPVLMFAVRPRGTIRADFFLARARRRRPASAVLSAGVEVSEGLTATASFDLAEIL